MNTLVILVIFSIIFSKKMNPNKKFKKKSLPKKNNTNIKVVVKALINFFLKQHKLVHSGKK